LISFLLRNLDSTDRATFMEWMSGQRRSSDIPPRAGYYLGWRVASALGRNLPLGELARLPDTDIRSAMVKELQALAS
jgi:uncharacterized protein YjaZ